MWSRDLQIYNRDISRQILDVVVLFMVLVSVLVLRSFLGLWDTLEAKVWLWLELMTLVSIGLTVAV